MNEIIIFNGITSKGNKYIIRYLDKKDAGSMHEYMNKLSQEKTFVNYQGEKISLNEEKVYLKDQLQRIKKKQTVQLLVLIKSKIVGVSFIDLGEGASNHEGVLGISILDGYRNLGIGGKLLELIINEAKSNLPNLKIITLTVFGNNQKAYYIYKKLGFREFGKLPKGVLFNEKYLDKIYMYKDISEI